MSAILVVNSGSSSLKYQVVDPATSQVLARGLLERIGQPNAELIHHGPGGESRHRLRADDHTDGLAATLEVFADNGPDITAGVVSAVGHRVVMGGDHIVGPTVITDQVVRDIEALSPLAPLHNPANVMGIRGAQRVFPDVPHVAVADTAFFHELPLASRTYALDREVARAHHIRRYGFHGTSHAWVSARVRELTDHGPTPLRQVVLHLGNGCSASAVVGDRPVETSMGLTPLEGLVMGTRTGDIDPAVVFHLARTAGMSVDQIDDVLNRRSGLKGLTGANDMREVVARAEAGECDADLALEIYAHRIRKYLGAYAATMGGLDAVAFTAGVGENSAVVRDLVCRGLEFLGVRLDPAANEASSPAERLLSGDAPVAVWAIPTNEELAIARQTAGLLADS